MNGSSGTAGRRVVGRSAQHVNRLAVRASLHARHGVKLNAGCELTLIPDRNGPAGRRVIGSWPGQCAVLLPGETPALGPKRVGLPPARLGFLLANSDGRTRKAPRKDFR